MARTGHERRIPSMTLLRSAMLQRFETTATPLLPRMSEARRNLAEGGLQHAHGLVGSTAYTFERSFLLRDIAQLAEERVSPPSIMSGYMRDQLRHLTPNQLNPLFSRLGPGERPITHEEAARLARSAEVVDYAEKVLDLVEISGNGGDYKGGSSVYFGSFPEYSESFPLTAQPNPWADRPGDRLPQPRQEAVALLLNEFGGLPLTLTAGQAEELIITQPILAEDPSVSRDDLTLRIELLRVSNKLGDLSNLVVKTSVENLYLVYSPSENREYYAAGFIIPSVPGARVMADAIPNFPLS